MQTVSANEMQTIQQDCDNACAICYKNNNNEYKTECDHIFCIECILKWSNTNIYKGSSSSCPICRQPISNKKIRECLNKLYKDCNISPNIMFNIKECNISADAIYKFKKFINLEGVSYSRDFITLDTKSNSPEWCMDLKGIISEHTYTLHNGMIQTSVIDFYIAGIDSFKNDDSSDDDNHYDDKCDNDCKNNTYDDNKAVEYAIYLRIYNTSYILNKNTSDYDIVITIDQHICELYDNLFGIFRNIAKTKYPNYKFIVSDSYNTIKNERKITLSTGFCRTEIYDCAKQQQCNIDDLVQIGIGNFIFSPLLIVLSEIETVLLTYKAIRIYCEHKKERILFGKKIFTEEED
jgi:hypothetical protein